MIALPAHRTLPTHALVAALGIAALALRRPGWPALAIVVAVGAAGILVPAVRDRPRPLRWVAAVTLGSAAFLAAPRTVPLLPAALPIAAALVAAVAEEAFFRRFLYGWLERRGAAVAIGATAALFGLVHVPMYGWIALPLDAAAGLVLGWQRWATGSWTAPAATHAAANLLAYLSEVP